MGGVWCYIVVGDRLINIIASESNLFVVFINDDQTEDGETTEDYE